MGSIKNGASLRLIHNLSKSLTCFDRAERLHHNMSVIFPFALVWREKSTKTQFYVCHIMSLYSPPYFGAVMYKCRTETSEVSRLICSKRLMGDKCFNNFLRQKHFITINTFLCSFRPYGPP